MHVMEGTDTADRLELVYRQMLATSAALNLMLP